MKVKFAKHYNLVSLEKRVRELEGLVQLLIHNSLPDGHPDKVLDYNGE